VTDGVGNWMVAQANLDATLGLDFGKPCIAYCYTYVYDKEKCDCGRRLLKNLPYAKPGSWNKTWPRKRHGGREAAFRAKICQYCVAYVTATTAFIGMACMRAP
jgi:hypothetical protein